MNLKEKILIVEDMAIIAADLKFKLEEFGYNVIGAVPSGEQAIVLADQQRPDLVLMDIILAGELDGIETAKLIQERFSSGILFLTSYLDQPKIERAKSIKPVGYLLKPYKIEQLKITVDMAIEKMKADKELWIHQKNLEDIIVVRTNELKEANVRLQFLTKRLTTINEIISLTDANINSNDFLQKTAFLMCEVFRFDAFAVLSYQAESINLILDFNTTKEIKENLSKTNVKSPIIRELFYDGKAYISGAYRNQHIKELENSGIRSSVILPISVYHSNQYALILLNYQQIDVNNDDFGILLSLVKEIGNKLEKIAIQNQLIQEKIKLEILFDSIKDYIFVLDKNGIIIKVSQSVCNRFKYNESLLLYKTLKDLIGNINFIEVDELVNNMMGGNIRPFPFKLKCKNGEIVPVEIVISAGRWPEQDVIICVCRELNI
jgi:PAS domain S-box-containing protein